MKRARGRADIFCRMGEIAVRDFFRSTRFKVFVIVAVFLLGLMIRTAVSGGFSTITASAVSVIVTPVQKLSATISNAFNDAVSNVVEFGTVKSENEKLKKQVSDLQSKLVDYNDMKRKNDEYNKVYGIYQENPDFKLQSASVISRDPGQWFSSFTIDKGTLEKISPQDPVITSDGLVGIVTEVMPTSAVVTTILDPSVSVGSFVSDTGDAGVSEGDHDLLSKNQFKITYLPKDSAAASGDIVVTSGRGGIFPKNLKIGTIQSVKSESSGVSLYGVCTPIVDPSSVKNVFVITDFNGKTASASSSSSSASGSSSGGGK